MERSCSSVPQGMGRQGIPAGCPDGAGSQPLVRDPPAGSVPWEQGTLGKVALPRRRLVRCSRLCASPRLGNATASSCSFSAGNPVRRQGKGGVALGCGAMLALVALQLGRAGGYKACFALLFLKSLLLSPVLFFSSSTTFIPAHVE